MTEVLTASQLKRLKEHKYSATGTSILEPYMQVFWRWLVEQIPRWWAPNAITLVGLIINIVTALLLVYYSPDGKHQIPPYAYVLSAVGLWVYQGLDAIDGKQARRTGSSTPLGELFDHGCDAVSIFFVMVAVCLSMQMGHSPALMFFECFAAVFTFYAAHWQTYASGILRFGRLDVTEAQMSVISIFLITAFFGEPLWTWQVPVLNVPLKMIPCYFSIGSALLATKNYFSVIFFEGGSGKNGSTIAGTSVLSPLIPIGIVITMAVMVWLKSETQIYENHPCLYILSFGMATAKVTNKLVVAHMTKSEMDLFDSSFIGPGMLFLNQYFNTVLDEYFVLWMCCIFCTADLVWYSTRVCRQICDYLDIYCFSITKSGSGEQMNGTSNDKSMPPNSADIHRPITRSSTKSKHS